MKKAVFAAFLFGCAAKPLPVGEYPPVAPRVTQASWPERYRPVSVLIATGLDDGCKESMVHAVDFYRERGVAYLNAHEVSSVYVNGAPYPGQIQIRLELPYVSHYAAETIAYRVGSEMEAAGVRFRLCSDAIARHEIGHALGLPDVDAPGNAMHWHTDGLGEALTPAQIGSIQ